MGKSSRIVVLSVLSVLTLCVFLVLLAVRPGNENTVLAQARDRQSQSLVDVNEPLETDPQTVSEAEAFAEEVRQMLLSDESFRNDIAQAVASDPAFTESISSMVREYVYSSADAYIAENGEAFLSAVDEKIGNYVEDNYAAALSVIRNEIESYVNENYDAAISIIRDEIGSYVAANYDELLSIIRKEVIGERIDEEELVSLLTEPVSEEVLARLSAYIDTIDFEALRAEIQAEVEAFASQLREYVDSARLTDEELEAAIEKVLAQWQARIVEEIASQTSGQPAAEEEQVQEEVPSEDAEPSLEKRVVNTPDFTGIPEVTDTQEYPSARESARAGAIEDLFAALGI